MQPNWIFLVFARVLYQCFSFDKKKIISFNKKKKSRPESGEATQMKNILKIQPSIVTRFQLIQRVQFTFVIPVTQIKFHNTLSKIMSYL